VTTDLAALGHDLRTAVVRRSEKRRRRRRLATTGVAGLFASVVAATAIASSAGVDLQLDPGEWSILGGGNVDDGRGAYVHAQRTADGSPSTFLVEHDAGLPRYEAFLLHERLLDAAGAAHEPGELCTPAELTRAEQNALDALRAGTAPPPAATPCRGLAYAAEQARLVQAGDQPASTLMPGVR
jgi:hypothetical protein